MGLNISGLVIDRNFEDRFTELQNELGWKLEKDCEVDFETASRDWKEDDICDVYFSAEGTLIFLNSDMCEEPFCLKKDNTLTFTISETSMVFNFNYLEKGVIERSILEVENNRINDEGEKLDVEENIMDTSEIILKQIETSLGESFWDIEPDVKVKRYRFVKTDKQKIVETKQKVIKEEKQSEPKKWWKLWK
jgi:hypothetical protein